MITRSEKFKKYIQDVPSYSKNEQTFYRFENNQGASVIHGSSSYGLEVAVIKWNKDDWDLDYTTELTGDVIGYVDDLDSVLQTIKKLPFKGNEEE